MARNPDSLPPPPQIETITAGGLSELEPGEDIRLRRLVVLSAAGIATFMSCLFWIIGAARGATSTERVIVSVLALVFGSITALVWSGRIRRAEVLMLTVGGAALLERIYSARHLHAAGLLPLTDTYEILIWMPSIFAVTVLLLQRREAMLFNLTLLSAAAFIVRDWLVPGGATIYHSEFSEFLMAEFGVILCLHAFAHLRDRFLDAHRMAVDLRVVAETDFLTGIDNRRLTTSHLGREIKRAAREGTSLSVMLFDLDRFKRINDEYGHEEGDRALCRVAALVERAKRDTDFFGRWGGEEFLLVAPDVDSDQCQAAAERLRKLIAEGSEEAGSRVTASFGIATYHFGDDVASLVKRADEALMVAKETGRDRVEVESRH